MGSDLDSRPPASAAPDELASRPGSHARASSLRTITAKRRLAVLAIRRRSARVLVFLLDPREDPVEAAAADRGVAVAALADLVDLQRRAAVGADLVHDPVLGRLGLGGALERPVLRE